MAAGQTRWVTRVSDSKSPWQCTGTFFCQKDDGVNGSNRQWADNITTLREYRTVPPLLHPVAQRPIPDAGLPGPSYLMSPAALLAPACTSPSQPLPHR